MQRLAEDVFVIPLAPRNAVNAYLLGDVLVDAGMRTSAKKILSELTGHPVSTHVITHAHVDHAGATKRVAAELDVPVWVGTLDAPAVRTGHAEVPQTGVLGTISAKIGAFPAAPVARTLEEGDEVGPGFTVLFTPGHSNGHISLWRESDRILVCGDVVNTMSLVTTKPGIQEPPRLFSMDPALNRASIRRIAELEPELILAGHGPAVRGPHELGALAASLPAG